MQLLCYFTQINSISKYQLRPTYKCVVVFYLFTQVFLLSVAHSPVYRYKSSVRNLCLHLVTVLHVHIFRANMKYKIFFESIVLSSSPKNQEDAALVSLNRLYIGFFFFFFFQQVFTVLSGCVVVETAVC